MGEIYAGGKPAELLTAALEDRLIAHSRTPAAFVLTGPLELSGSVRKFWVSTLTTPLYWDIVVEIKFDLRAGSDDIGRKGKSYEARSEIGIYVWPTEELVTEALAECVKTLMDEVDAERMWERK